MTRWARHFIAAALLLSSGCVSVTPQWAIPRAFRTPAVKAEKKAPKDEQSAGEQERPQREPAIAAETGRPRHDPATRMLIDAELRDATPEERQEWLAYLGSVEAAQVPYILRARRIAAGRGHEPLASVTPESEIIPAGHTDAGSGAGERPVLEKDAESVSTSHWQKRLKTFTDPNWLWSHSSEGDEPAPVTAERTDRGPFGLPLVLGSHSRSEPATLPLPPTAPLAPVVAPVVSPSPTAAPPAREPKLAPGSELWEDELQKLISLLEAETSAPVDPHSAIAVREDIHRQVALRLMYLISGEPQQSQEPIAGLPPAEQEFWTALCLGLGEYLDQSRAADPAERATLAAAQLRTAARQLQQAAKLQLRNMNFCQKINGFGSYETFAVDEFAPGQTVLVYAEIRNFQSQPTVDGQYRTRISSNVEILSEGVERQLISRSAFNATEDQCRALRSDYFHSYRIDLPPHLAPGPHVLKLTIQDELSGKGASETIRFVVR